MIWLIGCNGMLGSELGRIFTQKNIPWVGSDREVDITDPDALESFAQSHDQSANRTGYTTSKKIVPGKITCVINCAAYTDMMLAEENPEEADRVNNEGALNVARTTRKIGAKLIHISTSCIYDGRASNPYGEESPKLPFSVYGKTKLDGENAIQKEMTQYYILRTSWLYGSSGNNFVKSLLQGAMSKDSVQVANDMVGTPTSVEDFASVIVKIIETSQNATSLFGKNSAIPYGLYNYASQGMTTKFEFAKKVMEFAQKYRKISSPSRFDPLPSSDIPSERLFPRYAVLDCGKIYSALKMKVPAWDVGLERFIKNGLQLNSF